jgi:NAD(P)-dependent dehydrogenase (short-subunit alcohol dehydrogenase family)
LGLFHKLNKHVKLIVYLLGNIRRKRMSKGNRLEGKVAIITGATGGIGEATARLYLDQGAKLMLVGRSQEKLNALTKKLGDGDNIAYAIAEADNEQQTANAVQATIDAFGGVDILMANAGTEGLVGPIESQSYENWQRVLNVNVIGVWLSMKYCVAPMKARGGGSIIAISSVAGMTGFPGMSLYTASKHAVFGLVKTSSLELAESKIRVNAIGPGPIDNRMMHSLETQMAPQNSQSLHNQVEAMIPMKRYGTDQEVANMALFLGSDDSTYCTGSIHMVDGGFIAG